MPGRKIISMNRKAKKVVGIDLAGSPGRPTGLCILVGNQARVSVVFSDEEILQSVGKGAEAIAIDAPLSLPRGRCCLRDDCPCAGKAHFRVCDLELRRMKIKFFPITLGPMRQLTVRGMALKKRLEAEGFRVFETYPGAAQDIWGIPRQKDLPGLLEGLKRFKIGGNWLDRGVTRHELDAFTCALAAREDVKGNSMALGDPEEGLMILPKKG
jgi:predicted nuclease with RNAse H fold